MAFASKNFVKFNGAASEAEANINLWKYNAQADLQATVEAAGYFDTYASELKVNDLIYCIMADGAAIGLYNVSDITAGVVTMTGFATIGAGGVGTSQIDDLAVTTAKLAANAVTTAKITDANVTSAKIAANVIQYVAVTKTAANIIGMYADTATNGVLIAAGGADTIHRVFNAELVVDYGSAQYTGGGAIALQYDSTDNGAGLAASATLAAATLNAYSADSTVGLAGASASGAASAKVNKGIFLSNATGAFANGDSPVDVHIWYATVTAGL